MDLLSGMTSIEDKVKKLLLESAFSRDDDKRLILSFWKIHDHMDVENFDRWFLNEATPPETIRRCRQRVQEEIPNLRGTMWNARHEQALLVREEIVNGTVYR